MTSRFSGGALTSSVMLASVDPVAKEPGEWWFQVAISSYPRPRNSIRQNP
jgi:hypothetical protein